MMYPTLKDLTTGEIRKADPSWDDSFWQWTEGNYGCDCNKALAFFGRECEEAWGVKCGTSRFLTVDVHGDIDSVTEGMTIGGMTKEEIISEMNEGYLVD